jgi:hypothetical protein
MPAPFFKLGNYVFGHENNPGGATDKPVLAGVRRWRNQREDRASIGRSNRHPSDTGLKSRIKSHLKSEFFHEKAYALILISNKNVDGMNTEEGRPPVDAWGR